MQSTTLLVLGMAGSGKSTFTQRLVADAETRNIELKSVNLDPAVGGGKSEEDVAAGEEAEEEEGFEDWSYGIPYSPNVDIRDSVDYKKLMRSNELGPNGAIMLALNMFSTHLDELSFVVEGWKARHVDVVCVDTPGQIEVFTWSASGTLFTEMFSRVMPTVLVFVVDTVAMQSANTFVSVLFHACGVMLRTQLPLVLVFNKTDLKSAETQLGWMEDLDLLQAALDEESQDTQYMASLSSSISLMMHEFFESIHVVSVSSVEGTGMDEFYDKVGLAVKEYLESKEEEDAAFNEPSLISPGPKEETLPSREKQVVASSEHKRKFDDQEVAGKSDPASKRLEWLCPICRTNSQALCVCLKSNDPIPTSSTLPTATSASTTGVDTPKASVSSSWLCSRCQLSSTNAFCRICLTEREDDAVPPSGLLTTLSSFVNTVGGEAMRAVPSGLSQPPPPPWVCFQCTFKNAGPRETCEICAMAKKLSDEKCELDGVWVCPKCTFESPHTLPLCDICGSSKKKVEEVKLAPVAAPPSDWVEFQDGAIVGDNIWSKEEDRFFPLNATRDGRFVPKAVVVDSESVEYVYESDGGAQEEED